MSQRIGLHFGKGALIGTGVDLRGSEIVQTFLGNPRAYAGPDPHQDGVLGIAQYTEVTVVSHAAYVINIASDDPTTRARSRARLNRDLIAADAAGAWAVVVHPGSCAENMLGVARWRDFFEEYGAPPVRLLLENSAGRGIAQHPDQLVRLWTAVPAFAQEQVALCVDTAHAWSAGHTPLRFLQDVDAPVELLHLNGSSVEKGAQVDRHAAPGSRADRIGAEQLGEALWQAKCDAVCETWQDEQQPRPMHAFLDHEQAYLMASLQRMRLALSAVRDREGR